jgi:hypothetical protein
MVKLILTGITIALGLLTISTVHAWANVLNSGS